MVEQMMANQTKEISQMHSTQQKLVAFEQEIVRLSEECRQLRQQNKANVEAELNRICNRNIIVEPDFYKLKLTVYYLLYFQSN